MIENQRRSLWISAAIHKEMKILAAQESIPLNVLVDKMAAHWLTLINKKRTQNGKPSKNGPPI